MRTVLHTSSRNQYAPKSGTNLIALEVKASKNPFENKKENEAATSEEDRGRHFA